MAQIDILLRHAFQAGASDLHLRSGAKPRLRMRGRLEIATDFGDLAPQDLQTLMAEILRPEQVEKFAQRRELDFAYGTPDTGRFRCNYFLDHNGPGVAFRRIPSEMPTLESLNLPEEVGQFAHVRRGLVLITGATGSGKTSTLAAVLDVINENYRKHVITLEDPIEFIHGQKLSVFHQRGLGYDIPDFQSGIMDSMRQDPDVLMIGELRDVDSIRQALVAAELGMLVITTLHTNSAAESVDRIVDVFPPEEQPEVRAQLSQALAGVVSQALLHRIDRDARIPATEVLVSSPAVGAIIREGKSQEIQNHIQTGKERGMHTMDDSLEKLLKREVIDGKEAFLYARQKSRFERYLDPQTRAARRMSMA